MANQQAFQAYPQDKGTLTPGQNISVNKHTVQVERYLSQGKWSSGQSTRLKRPIYYSQVDLRMYTLFGHLRQSTTRHITS